MAADHRPNMLVSFSGGRSSAYMAKRLLDGYSHAVKMEFVFANTGLENSKTLDFVERCSQEWDIHIVWVEAVVHHAEVASTHRIVNYKWASRNGEPMEKMIEKYGIPNKAYPHCTRELKLNPIRSYLASLGWKDYLSAVGIRADEPDRLRINAEAEGICYPLAHWFPTSKPLINDWWETQPFKLGLLEREGNCSACYKKSDAKLVMIAKESPQHFDFPLRMEAIHGLSGYNEDGTKRTFFRQHKTAQNYLDMASILSPRLFEDADEDQGCAESCEPF